MTDYSELVKALRRCAEPGTIIDECDTSDDCPYSLDGYCGDCMNNLVKDAAAAIEALQAEIRESMQKCAECGDRMVEPKRGEWVELADRNERKYSHTCSNCHRFHIHEGEIEFYHYCPNCGAKMEVQE